MIYKIFRAAEMAAFVAAGETTGAPVDVADGFVHFSTAAQAPEDRGASTSPARTGCGCVACDPEALGPALRWEPSRGGALFPHLYRALAPRRRRLGAAAAAAGGGSPLPGRSRRERRRAARAARAARARSRNRARAGAAGAAARAGAARRADHRRRAWRATLAGLALPNPLGLAAGFDKNAVAVGPLLRAGFGFVEVGAATPLPQPGNPRPRLFRLARGRRAINRFGFNNDGVAAIAARLAAPRPPGVVGLNLGANKTSADRAADFAEVLARAGGFVDFATVNVSSPNTERLRDLQGAAALDGLLAGVMAANAALARPVPVFVKIAPDLDDAELVDLVAVAMERRRRTAIVATNTTLARDGLRRAAVPSRRAGCPASRCSRARPGCWRGASVLTQGRVPLIGVGGVASAAQAYAKIRAGASALQLYTGLVYGGLALAGEILAGLDALLAADGFASVAEAVGQDAESWSEAG